MKLKINFGKKGPGIIFIALLAAFQLSCVQVTMGQDASKQQEKLSRQEQNAKNKQQILELVKNKNFVLENDFIQNKYGYRVFVNPMFNFVKVQGDTATIQLTFDHLPGWNGVGGITVQGKIDEYDVSPGKARQPVFLKMHVQGAGIASYQFLSIDANGNSDLNINGDAGGTVTFLGNIVPIDKSGIIEGYPGNN